MSIDYALNFVYNKFKKSNNGQIQDGGAPRRQLKGDTKMKYFQNCSTIEELKKEYRRLALINHPDNGGNPEKMKTINAEYEKAFNRLKDIHNKAAADDTTGKKRKMNETAGEYMEVIQKIIAFSGIVIELCGSWVWVSGNTYEYKDAFKAAGFRWASKKKMWCGSLLRKPPQRGAAFGSAGAAKPTQPPAAARCPCRKSGRNTAPKSLKLR